MKTASIYSPKVKKSLLRGASIFVLLSLVPMNAVLASEEAASEDVGNSVSNEKKTRSSSAISEDNRYYLRLITQIYDGREDLSQTQILGLARARRGNRSYSQFDFGDGAVVITGQKNLSLGRFSNKTSVEQAVEYDYSTKTVIGDTRYARFHNNYVRPQLGKSPDLDSNAQWNTSLPISAFGMNNIEGGDVKIELSREYFEYNGKPMVLVHYSIPAFAYDVNGKKVVQWGQGFSLTDPGFGQIYINAALHRSAVRENGSVGNPYRYARTMVAANPDGSAMVDYRSVAQLAPYIDTFFSKDALQVIPTKKSVPIVDRRPLVLAQNMDLMALSIGEDGANEVPITAGAQTSGDRGVEIFDVEKNSVFNGGIADRALKEAGARATTQDDSIIFEDGSDLSTLAEEVVHNASTNRTTSSFSESGIEREAADDNVSGRSGDTFEDALRDLRSSGGSPGIGSPPEIGGPPGGGTTSGSILDEVTPGTIREIEQSRNEQENSGQQSSNSFIVPPNQTTFGGQGNGNTPPAPKLGKAEYLGKALGGEYIAAVGKSIDEFNDYVGKYGTDKFLAAGGGISELQQLQGSLAREIDALSAASNTVLANARNTQSSLVSVGSQIQDLERIILTESLAKSDLNKAFAQLDDLKTESNVLKQEIRALDGQVTILAQIKKQLPGLQSKFEAFSKNIPNSKGAKALARISNSLGKANGVLGFLGGVGAVGGVYQTSSDLGDFDTTSNDLGLSGDYSSAGAIASDITLNLLGILGNAATGNFPAVAADVLSFSTDKAVDLHKVIASAEQTELDTLGTQLDTELNRKKARNTLQEKLTDAHLSGDKERYDLLAKAAAKIFTVEESTEFFGNLPTPDYDSPIFTNEVASDGGASDPNAGDPRLDADSGLPKPAYWTALKETPSGRAKLASFGIDPDAPVGGWPGGIGKEHNPGVKPSDGSRPTPKTVTIQPTDRPSYPTKDPKTVVVKEKKETPLPPTQLTDAQIAEIETSQRQAAAQEYLDKRDKERLDAENERRRKAGETEIAKPDEFETAEEREAAAQAYLDKRDRERLDAENERRRKAGETEIQEPDKFETAEEREAAAQAYLDKRDQERLDAENKRRREAGETEIQEPDKFETAEEREAAAQAYLDKRDQERLDAENKRRREAGETEIQEPDKFETAEERKAAAQAELKRIQGKKLAEQKKAKEDGDKKPKGSGGGEYTVSELEISTLDVTPLPEFEIKEFKNPDFDFPEYTPAEFSPPKPSQFPPTDPDDRDGYPGTGQYPAFDFEEISFTFNTDLSKYEEWLKTQNLAHLDRLAMQAGFPNFAAAAGEAEFIIRFTRDPGFRSYALSNPACSPSLGCIGVSGEFARRRSLLALGDLLNDSRDLFSTGGFSDIGISGFRLGFSLTDFGIQDGDLVDVEIFQFGRRTFHLQNHLLLTAGTDFSANLQTGVSQLVITALNEGTASPNTAAVGISNVVNGDANQNFSLETFQTAILRIETNASADEGQ